MDKREPDIEYWVNECGRNREYRTSDASIFTTLTLCDECKRFIPTKPDAHRILHKVKYHGGRR